MQTKVLYAKPRPLLWVGIIFLAILSSPLSAEYIKSGISLCINTVIPAVFPFMIISSLITVSGSAVDIGSFFKKPLEFLFGVDSAGACAISLGFLCGYPTGALTAVKLFDRGELSKSELEYLLTFMNIPSAPFVISGVGASMLLSKELGIAIYASVLLSAIIVGIILRPFNSQKNKIKAMPSPSSHKVPFSFVISESIWSAAKNMLGVCACVITFSALSGTLCSSFPMPELVKVAISGFFEVSSGTKIASTVPLAPVLCASVCAWSGLSVHFQIISACRGRGISFVPFFVSKAVQTFLAPALLLLYIGFCR